MQPKAQEEPREHIDPDDRRKYVYHHCHNMESHEDCNPLVWRNSPNYIPELEDYEIPEDWWRNGYEPFEGENAADEATKYEREHCPIPPPPKEIVIEPTPIVIEPRPVVRPPPKKCPVPKPKPVVKPPPKKCPVVAPKPVAKPPPPKKCPVAPPKPVVVQPKPKPVVKVEPVVLKKEPKPCPKPVEIPKPKPKPKPCPPAKPIIKEKLIPEDCHTEVKKRELPDGKIPAGRVSSNTTVAAPGRVSVPVGRPGPIPIASPVQRFAPGPVVAPRLSPATQRVGVVGPHTHPR